MHRLKREFPADDTGEDSESDEEMEVVRKREQTEMMRLTREVLFFPQSQAGDLLQDQRLEYTGNSEVSQKKPQVSYARPCTYMIGTLRSVREKEVYCRVNFSYQRTMRSNFCENTDFVLAAAAASNRDGQSRI